MEPINPYDLAAVRKNAPSQRAIAQPMTTIETELTAARAEIARLREESTSAIESWIDRLEQYCEGCGHYFIDVTASRDLQMDSHALADGDEGYLSVCAHCWSIDAARPAEGK